MRVVATARAPGSGSGVNNENIGMYDEPSAMDHVHSLWEKWTELPLNPPWIPATILGDVPTSKFSVSANLLYIQFSVKTPTSTPGNHFFATLPPSVRPSVRMSIPNVVLYNFAGGPVGSAWWLFIETDGRMFVWYEDTLSNITHAISGMGCTGGFGKILHDDN